MDRLEIGFTGLAAVLALIALRVPIGLVLVIVSFCGIWAATNLNAAWGLVRAVPFQFIANWSFSAVPMFLLMGFVASNAGLTNGLFKAMRILLRKLPGGLACSTVGASALFAAASGSSVATAAAMSRIAVPEMIKAGYDKALATGSVAASGTLGSLIPPSILMILFGIFTQTSIGALFMAGFIPGVISAVIYMAMIVIRSKLNPSLAPPMTETPAPGELSAALREVWPLPLLILGVLGGIMTGVMTPTEAGAVGAGLAVVIAVARGSLTVAIMRTALREAASGTSVVFVIAMGASMFTSFMGLTGLPRVIADTMLSVSTNPLILILMIAIVYILMGMFIDSIGLMLLTLPVLIPLLGGADVNMIWFGIIIIKLLEIGLITPPVGLNVYVINSALRGAVPLTTVFRGAMWFLAMDVVTLVLLVAFPSLVLWLPSLMAN
ncbi:TRAP transporter large permease [Pararhodobacter sp. CCB-MM2]|uniref:TRAP transporter large permease n=1 Tax=Pararhodobacter sp. CCB-MM2 TaxID=1786003 RepID=UPI000831CE9F|nr:TRAP transporter large permease [Pararhodobacter sp. CCB-MM2]MCA2012070.1 TRAP transporter large permease [Cereibacter sphaeroides]